ncbi:unnamed protein product [Polarella glacialis]|uniref:Uncharacterized protein n=1 Tax=Polarella glacialis TaxID=89957 RepID=A0A813DYL3_POLGL|nr:unnamed protein product [Polarella glacialis]
MVSCRGRGIADARGVRGKTRSGTTLATLVTVSTAADAAAGFCFYEQRLCAWKMSALPGNGVCSLQKHGRWCLTAPCNSVAGLEELDERSYCCIHRRDDLANESESAEGRMNIMKGLHLTDLESASQWVRDGVAAPDEFLLLCGFCGWSPYQLQHELDWEDCWVLAAANAEALLGDLFRKQGALRRSRRAGLTVTGSGLSMWDKLYRRLDPAAWDVHELHGDAILKVWCKRMSSSGDLSAVSPLVGSESSNKEKEGADPQEEEALPEALQQVDFEGLLRQAAVGLEPLATRTILVASATSFLLSMPSSVLPLDDDGLPPQYLHKAVLALVRPCKSAKQPAAAVLLNGPRLPDVYSKVPGFGPSRLDSGQRSGKGVYFGGNHQDATVIKAFGRSFLGMVLLPPGVLQVLLRAGALSIAEEGIRPADILALPRSARWAAAGGAVAEGDAALAALGDEQRRGWYETFLEVDYDDEADGDERRRGSSEPAGNSRDIPASEEDIINFVKLKSTRSLFDLADEESDEDSSGDETKRT